MNACLIRRATFSRMMVFETTAAAVRPRSAGTADPTFTRFQNTQMGIKVREFGEFLTGLTGWTGLGNRKCRTSWE
jgi:hypothetical protein